MGIHGKGFRFIAWLIIPKFLLDFFKGNSFETCCLSELCQTKFAVFVWLKYQLGSLRSIGVPRSHSMKQQQYLVCYEKHLENLEGCLCGCMYLFGDHLNLLGKLLNSCVPTSWFYNSTLKRADLRSRTEDCGHQESEDCGELLMSSDAEGLEPPVLPHD